MEISQGTECSGGFGGAQPSTQTPGSATATHRFSVLLLCGTAEVWLNVLAQQGQGAAEEKWEGGDGLSPKGLTGLVSATHLLWLPTNQISL